MTTKQFKVDSEQEMLSLGEILGQQCRLGDVIFLNGDLGAGKTTFTKGIARGLEIDEIITSPTFQLRKTYEGRLILNHLDLYRLAEKSELAVIDPEEFTQEGVTVVEWGDLLKEYLNQDYLEVNIEAGIEPQQRQLSITAIGPTHQELLEAIPTC